MAKYSVPYKFVAGTRARASQVNANFEYLGDAITDVDNSKAELEGNSAINFNVSDPIAPEHAVSKRYLDSALASSGGGSGVGKSLFEVFHTLSTKTPPGAFSLRNGDLVLNASSEYPTFWASLEEQSATLIPDFTEIKSGSIPSGYATSFTNIFASDKTYINRVFSPYSWFTSSNAPTSSDPIVAFLELPELITCEYFRINSHVVNTYNSMGDADPLKAIRVAAISVQRADDSWEPVCIINDSEVPVLNSRHYKNSMPDLEFKAIRIVVSENFGASSTDISLYPVDPKITTVRSVPEAQWQWEVNTYGETGAFVINKEDDTIRLPKVIRFLSGVSDLWQVGMPEAASASNSSKLFWQEDGTPVVEGESNSVVSLNSVGTGLWIQAYNAVAEDALANVKYIPHSVLFEERLFHFVPDVSTGYAVCDGGWFDGTYYTAAYVELDNQYSQAVSVPGKSYSLAPNGMRFVSDEVYKTTLSTYGESPYYVIDRTNKKFKVPCSNNYRRCTSTLDNTGDLILDSAPNIVGSFDGNGDDGAAPKTGAFYQGGTVTGSNGSQTGYYIHFDASRCSAVYGRADEVRPKSSYSLLCVFLGNEVPQSSAVDVFVKLKEQDEKIAAIQGGSLNEVMERLDAVESINEAQSTSINNNAEDIAVVKNTVKDQNEAIDNISSDVTAVSERVELLNAHTVSISERVSATEGSIATINENLTGMDSDIAALQSSKQDKLIPSGVIKVEDDGATISADLSNYYTKQEVDAALEDKASTASVSAIDSRLGGLSLVKLTQEEYDALVTKDENTLYVIIEATT